MATEHIYKQFDSDLESIRSKALEMGTLVEEQIENSVKSLLDSDTKLAKKVIGLDIKVNDFETIIDEDCALIIAKRSPAAGDLRNILMMLKIISDLERIGDEAMKIAQATIRIFEADRMSKPRFKEIKVMTANVQSMLRDALNSFARLDTTDTIDVLKRDQEVDDDYRSYMRQLITFMLEDPRTISMSIESIFVAKSLERIGDHAQNIAEGVIYSVSGTDVRHASMKEIKKTLSN
jgi:phosphate transport system protein